MTALKLAFGHLYQRVYHGGARPHPLLVASGEAEVNAASRKVGGESGLVSPYPNPAWPVSRFEVRQRRIGTQAKGLAWQVALKLDAPLIRHASDTDSLDQECQRHVGDRR